MPIKFLLITLISFQLLYSKTLDSIYYIDSNTITLGTIIPSSGSEDVLFKIKEHRHSKRLSSKRLVSILKKHGYYDYKYENKYVNFIKKSPIDTTKIKNALQDYYESKYPSINIRSINVMPREYTQSIPNKYIVNIDDKDYLQKNGIINIKTLKNKKIFFNYEIDATVDVHVSRSKIKKGTKLSAINTSKKRVTLDVFKGEPVDNILTEELQAKHHISKDKIITTRDVDLLSVVKRNSNINVTMRGNNMNISFSAKALQNAKLNDIIKVQKSNGKILKVRVTGKNRAEIR